MNEWLFRIKAEPSSMHLRCLAVIWYSFASGCVSSLPFFWSAARRPLCFKENLAGRADSQAIVLEDLLPVCFWGCCFLGLCQGEIRKEANAHGFYFWVTSSVSRPSDWIYRLKEKDKMCRNDTTACATEAAQRGTLKSTVGMSTWLGKKDLNFT